VAPAASQRPDDVLQSGLDRELAHQHAEAQATERNMTNMSQSLQHGKTELGNVATGPIRQEHILGTEKITD
jgi:hypothetical protein